MIKWIFSSAIAVYVNQVYSIKDSPCGPIASHDWTTNRKIPLRSQRLCGETDFERKKFSPKTPMKSRKLASNSTYVAQRWLCLLVSRSEIVFSRQESRGFGLSVSSMDIHLNPPFDSRSQSGTRGFKNSWSLAMRQMLGAEERRLRRTWEYAADDALMVIRVQWPARITTAISI